MVELVPADMGEPQAHQADMGEPQAHQREAAAMTGMTVSCRVLAEQRAINHEEVVGSPARAPDSAQVRGSRMAVRGRAAWQERADGRLGTQALFAEQRLGQSWYHLVFAEQRLGRLVLFAPGVFFQIQFSVNFELPRRT